MAQALARLQKRLRKPVSPVATCKDSRCSLSRYDEATDLGEKLKIRNVPLFQFYMDNCLVEQFATREKQRIGRAINKHVGWEVCHL